MRKNNNVLYEQDDHFDAPSLLTNTQFLSALLLVVGFFLLFLFAFSWAFALELLLSGTAGGILLTFALICLVFWLVMGD